MFYVTFEMYFLKYTGCLRNYRKSILLLLTSVLGRLRDLPYIFAVTYESSVSPGKVYFTGIDDDI